MKIVDFQCCLAFLLACLFVVPAAGQISQNSPQPDDDPVAVQTADQVFAQFDKDANQQFDQDEMRNLLKLMITKINELQREVQALQQQCELLQSQQPNLQIMRKPSLLLPPDGGVYGGKYYPPAQSVKR